MNLKQFEKGVGRNFRLRPLPIRIDWEGNTLPPEDDLWQLQEVQQNPKQYRLSNLRTDHFMVLQPDNIREFRSPDFLVLRAQVQIRGHKIQLEPIIPTRLSEADLFIRLERQMPDLLAAMRRDLTEAPLAREFVILPRGAHYWAQGHELGYYIEDYAHLVDKLHILRNHDLIQDVTYNNTTRFLMSEPLAAYLTGEG
jgi:hypothetical protein